MKQWQKEILEKTKDEPLAPVFLCRPALKAEILKRVQEVDLGIGENAKERVTSWVIDELIRMKVL